MTSSCLKVSETSPFSLCFPLQPVTCWLPVTFRHDCMLRHIFRHLEQPLIWFVILALHLDPHLPTPFFLYKDPGAAGPSMLHPQADFQAFRASSCLIQQPELPYLSCAEIVVKGNTLHYKPRQISMSLEHTLSLIRSLGHSPSF